MAKRTTANERHKTGPKAPQSVVLAKRMAFIYRRFVVGYSPMEVLEAARLEFGLPLSERQMYRDRKAFASHLADYESALDDIDAAKRLLAEVARLAYERAIHPKATHNDMREFRAAARNLAEARGLISTGGKVEVNVNTGAPDATIPETAEGRQAEIRRLAQEVGIGL